MSCICQECKKKYKVDLLIPDSLWEAEIKPKNAPKGCGMLCGECITRKIEALGQYNAYTLIPIAYA